MMATNPIAGGKSPGIDLNKGVQELSIQWLSLKRIQKYTDLAEDKISQNPLGEIVKRIITVYNQKKLKMDAENSTQAKDHVPDVDKPEKAGEVKIYKGQFEHLHEYKYNSSYDYKLQVYQQVEKTKSGLVRNLEEGGVSQDRLHKRKATDFLLFFFRQIPSREIVAVTSGNAWEAIRPCVNYKGPLKIAERILDPNRIVEMTRSCLLGSGIKETIHNPAGWEISKVANLYYLIESFRCTAKQDSSLVHLLKLKKACDISIRTGNLRIHKKIPLTEFPSILDLFSKCVLGRDTYRSKGIKESTDQRFEFLHFLKAVSAAKEKLDLQLATQIFNAFQAQRRQACSFRHKYFQNYFEAHTYEIKYPTGSRFQQLEGRPESVEEILGLIGADDENALSSVNSLLTALKKAQFRYTGKNNKKETAALIEYLEGEVRDTDGNTYFRVRGMWYKLALDYHALLNEDFKGLLRQTLIKSTEEGQLPRPWKGNKPQGRFLQKELGEKFKITKGIRDFVKKLKEAKVSFVDKKGNVKQTKLVGEILNIKIISDSKTVIENNILNGTTIPSKNTIKKILGKHADKILAELKKERPVLKENKSKDVYVANPFPYPLENHSALKGKYQNFVKYLKELFQQYNDGVEDEETYNRSYLSKTYGHEKGYLVFDQICPHNIEPCDVVKFTKDTTYLYHIKETLGQHTRDACSQILNAAKEFRNALSVHQADNFLQLLWKMGTAKNSTEWRLQVKKQLEALGEDEFFKIFQERKIVFVYAFLEQSNQSLHNEVKTKSKLTPEDLPFDTQEEKEKYYKKLKEENFLDAPGRITGKFCSSSQQTFEIPGEDKNVNKAIYNKVAEYKSVSNSTLAKFELLHVAREVRALGFEFKICQIQPTTTQVSSEESYPTEAFEASVLGAIESDDAIEGRASSATSQHAETINNGPTGLWNIGNSCYMNAVLQVIFNIPEIRQIINQFKAKDGNKSSLIHFLQEVMRLADPSNGEPVHSANVEGVLKKFRNQVFQERGDGELTGKKIDQQDAQEFLQFILNKLDWKPIQLHTQFKTDDEEWFSNTSLTNHLSVSVDNTGSFQELLDTYFAFEEMDATVNKKLEPLQHEEDEYDQWKQALYIKDPLPSHLALPTKSWTKNQG